MYSKLLKTSLGLIPTVVFKCEHMVQKHEPNRYEWGEKVGGSTDLAVKTAQIVDFCAIH